MTEFIQKFLLKNTKPLQYLINQKLAKRKGAIGKFFSWMEIGPRNHGDHIIPKMFRFFNTFLLNFGFRFNWGRPHITKWFTKEREIYITGYAAMFIFWAWFARKNRIRPLYRYEDYHLHDYDKPAKLTNKWNMYVPFNVMNFKTSAHYIEIDRIFSQEMSRYFSQELENVKREFDNVNEKERRTRYVYNPNYIYEPFGWESA